MVVAEKVKRRMGGVKSQWRELLSSLPGYDPFRDAEEYEFDCVTAQRVLDFFPECLVHVKGQLAGTPLQLAKWQKAIVANLFGWRRKDNGLRRYREAFIFVPRKNGKALALDTPIVTPTGWTNIGDLQVGDNVFDDNGLCTQVTYVSPIMENHKCYRVNFSDGESIVADAEHLWLTKTRKPENKTSLWTTEEIGKTLLNGKRPGINERNHRIEVASALQLGNAVLPIPPYVLGVWLGDGHSASARFTYGLADIEILEHIEANQVTVSRRRKDKRSNAATCLLGGSPDDKRHSSQKPCLQKELRKLGVINNKYIPDVYLRSSISQRISLLQGLMDTDGYVSAAGQCEFTSTNKRLAEGFRELLSTLGIKSSLKKRRALLYGKDCGPKYRIQFWAFKDMPVFLLRRKIHRLKEKPQSKTRTHTRQIISVDPVDSVPVRCIQVDSSSHLYLAGKTMIPTHNSTLAAGIILYTLLVENEPGAEIYSAAAEHDQAKLIFDVVKGMILARPDLSAHTVVYRNSVIRVDPVSKIETGSFYKPLSADASTKHGYNVYCVVVDELHAQKNRELVDVLETGTASRREPLIVHITTSDFDRPSICNEKYDYACKVRDGLVDDANFLPVIYEASLDDDWKSPEVWAKANPNLGVSLSVNYLKRQCQKAVDEVSFENTFRRLHLNVKTEQEIRWLAVDQWDACSDKWAEVSLVGKRCYAGLDLSTNTDITAFVMVFPVDGERYVVIPRCWIPGDNAHKREERDRVPYIAWSKQGFIRLTPGNVIDYNIVIRDILADCKQYNVEEIAFDRWNFEALRQQLLSAGVADNKLIAFGQGYASMSAPMKKLEQLVLGGKLIHNNNPLMRWCVGNVVADLDPAGNIKPSKSKSTERIDPIVALIMAIGRIIVTGEPKPSVYESRGILRL